MAGAYVSVKLRVKYSNSQAEPYSTFEYRDFTRVPSIGEHVILKPNNGNKSIFAVTAVYHRPPDGNGGPEVATCFVEEVLENVDRNHALKLGFEFVEKAEY